MRCNSSKCGSLPILESGRSRSRPQRQPDVAGRQRGADDHRRRADYPDVAQAWTKFMRCMIVALAGSLFFSGPLATWFVRLSQKIGVDILKERHERGAMLVSAAVLAGEIDAHNAAEFAAELAERHPTMAADRVAAPPSRRAGAACALCHGGIAYPWRLEQTHAMLIGTTGAGKTTQLRKLVTEARERPALRGLRPHGCLRRSLL
jgi:hypothetical protein